MNRLYGLIAAVCICFALFMTLALSGRQAEDKKSADNPAEDSSKKSSVKPAATGKLQPRESGRELRLALDTEPQTLDPISVSETGSDGVACKIYNKLVRLKFDEKGELKPMPDLSESFTISSDNKTYTFKLRKGVKFHNGREMKAADVVYSLKRLLSPMSKRAELMQPFVKGSEEYYKANKPDDVTHEDPNLGIRALDEYTAQIELNEPFAPFLQHLCTISCAIVPREAAEDKKVFLSRAPVGTGPFKLDPDDWASNRQLLLKRFDDYFDGKPKLEAIKFLIYKDKSLHLKLFMAGQLDAAVIPNGHVRTAEADVGMDNILIYSNVRTNYLGFGMPTGKFKDKADLVPWGHNKLLRQAMNLALDREYICKTILEGRAVPAHGVLPPGMAGFKKDRPPIQRDLAKARELLKQAGYPEGKGLPPVTMLIRNDEDTKNIAQAMQHDFEEIGVKVNLQPRDWNRFVEEVEQEPKPIFMLGWVADYPDPDNFLYVLFNTRQHGSAGNHTFYTNPQVDELTTKARSITSMDERSKIYAQVEDIILEEVPWICTYCPKNEVLRRKEVKGIRPTALDTGTEFPQVDFKDVEIDYSGDSGASASIDTQIGKEATFTGVAINSKTGLQLQTAAGTVYVEGISEWPQNFAARTVTVGGILEVRFDLPVYIQKEGEPLKEGIPLKEGADLKAASKRYVIKLTKMEVLP